MGSGSHEGGGRVIYGPLKPSVWTQSVLMSKMYFRACRYCSHGTDGKALGHTHTHTHSFLKIGASKRWTFLISLLTGSRQILLENIVIFFYYYCIGPLTIYISFSIQGNDSHQKKTSVLLKIHNEDALKEAHCLRPCLSSVGPSDTSVGA